MCALFSNHLCSDSSVVVTCLLVIMIELKNVCEYMCAYVYIVYICVHVCVCSCT